MQCSQLKKWVVSQGFVYQVKSNMVYMRGSQLKKELGPLVHSSKSRTCFWMACIETCCAFVTVTSATPFWGDN